MNLPGGTITFLFTDIEGSTRLWEDHPQAMPAALAHHDLLLHRAIAEHNGYVFKTVGDAFCAVFAVASDALHAAVQSHLSLLNRQWEQTGPLRVRIALHTGEAQERDGDYFGQTLNRVARLQSCGYGQQTLLSQSTYAIVCDSLPPSLVLVDLGLHRLKDLQRPEHVFQLNHPALPSAFPPLKSLDSPELPNNLPQQLTSFIGRETEMQAVRALLDKTRLLTLTGSGGCGKTRLALQVAADLLDSRNCVWLVELASIADPALVPQAVASVLNVREEAGKTLVQTLVDSLQAKPLLLLLDNCEHVLDACSHLSDILLKSCPQMQILASSREALGIAGEQTYHVPSLSLPSQPTQVTPQSLSEYEAARLFIERATAILSTFAVTDANAPPLAQLCVRLDGIPLALELAAARVRSLSVEEINARLDNRFRLLTGGSRTALPRQQTLRALIDWSYDLLHTQEKTLLCRLAVFAGGWTLEAAEQVCALFPDDLLDLLTSLVDKSLVVVEQQEEQTRYRLLETVRQYARDRLVEQGEIEAVRERHQAYFVTLVEAAEPQLNGPEQAVWLERLEREHDNLRAALEWGNPEVTLRMASALWRFWTVRGYFTEGREWLAGVLAGAAVQARTPLRAKALYVAGALASSQGDYAAARTLSEESLAIHRELGNKRGIANLLHSLGIVATNQGDYTVARTLYAESLALSRESGDRRDIANLLHSLGIVASSQGDYTAARTLSEESLAIHRELGNKRGIANLLHSLGIIASSQGDYATARTRIEEGLAIQRELGNRRGIANLLHSLGIVASHQGDYADARVLSEESLAIHRELGNKRGIASLLLSLGNIASRQGDYAMVRTLIEESLAIQQELGNRRGIASALEAFAALASVQEQITHGVRLWGAAEALRETLHAPLPPSDRPRYDRQVAQARSTLGAEDFAAAWSEGRSLMLEQSIENALEKPIP